jgi:hypothetical protein
MTVQYVKINKYNEITEYPEVDLIFTGPKKSLVDRVSGKSLQFTRNTIGTYVDENGIIQTAAAGEPRYTYDPVTGEELGLLVEESRTNLHLQSQDFSTWIGDGTTPTSNSGLAPDGTNTANLIQEKAETNSHYLQKPDASVTSGTTYTFSVFLKKGSGATAPDWIVLAFSGNGFPGNGAVFNIATGELGNTAVAVGQVISSGISEFPGGWYRCHVTVTADETRNSSGIIGFNNNQNTAGLLSYAGQTTSDVYAWGAQLEAGSFPSSYIPTSGSTVTRDPDTVTLTNDNIYNNSQFDIVNDPFGMSAGSNTLTLLPSNSENSEIKRATIFSPNIAQTKINSFAGKTDEFWKWRVLGSSFGLPSFLTDGQVTVDWGDGTIETLTTSDHTFTDGGGYHDIGFRLDSGTYFRPTIGGNAAVGDKIYSVGPAPESMKVDANQLFWNCDNLKSVDATFDIVNSANSAFYLCDNLKNIPKVNTTGITDFTNFARECSSLTSFPLIDTSSGTNFSYTWYNCNSLTSFPPIDTSSGNSFVYTWSNCNNLTSFPWIDTSNGTSFAEAWRNCTSLTIFPQINTSSGTDFSYTWRDCTSLTIFPLINTSSGTNFSNAWRNCSSLTNFPANFFDSWTGTPDNNCFLGTWDFCSSLTATSVENILNSIDTSGQSAPASGVDITIDYNASSGTPSVSTAVTNLTNRNWTITLNGVAQ